ncbi:hypothetical protein LDENG_00210610 [Lucifuga dentata]|nr:hypothetical protein LDENG_00210610 [Lucifuga dentata]
MFPSSGFFATTACPFSKRGVCDRPHCFYQHAGEVEVIFGAKYKSSPDSTGYPNSYASTDDRLPVAAEAKDGCFQLEQINKKIETVKHEVEKEQRRLSHYQTDARNTTSNFCVSKLEMAGKNVDRDSCRPSACTDLSKPYSQARKYVIDNSKPRTDLEYDPLSNFSADLQSYSSSSKDQKLKNGKGMKRVRDSVYSDQKKSVTHQAANFIRSPSPELLDDSIEDDVLIIDISPSPEKKRTRTQKRGDAIVSMPDSDESDKDLNEVELTPIIADSPPLHLANRDTFKVTSPCARVDEYDFYNNCGVKTKDPFNFPVSKECENVPVDVTVIDLTRCLEDLRHRTSKVTCFQATEAVVEESPELEGLRNITDSKDHSDLVVEEEVNTFCADISQRELPCGVEKMSPVQLCDVSKTNLLFHETPAYSFYPCRQHAKQVQYLVSNHSSPVQTVLPSCQKISNQTPAKMQIKCAVNHASPESCLEQTESYSASSQCQTEDLSLAPDKARWTDRAESSSAAAEKFSAHVSNEEVIIIDSSSEEEEEEEEAKLNFSEMEVSDSDPMEECYRIFIEANKEKKGSVEQPEMPVTSVDGAKLEVNVKPEALPGKKRVSREVENRELGAMSRPQPQVLVPLQGAAVAGLTSQPSVTSRIQQVQQRASMLKAAVNGGQAFVSSSSHRGPESQIPANKPAPAPNAYNSCVLFETAVIEVEHDLHLILPEDTLPLPAASSSSPVPSRQTPVTSAVTPLSSVLTPITHMHKSLLTPKPKCQPAAHRHYKAPPLIIPPLHRKKPSRTFPAFASSHSSPVTSTPPQPAAQATAKPVANKRKVKQHHETAKDKVPHDIRQCYINKFTEEFLKMTVNVNDAFEKALAEERTVYNRSVNKLKYLSVAVNALKRLKNQSALAAKDDGEVNSQKPKGNIPLNLERLEGSGDVGLYESLKDYVLTEEMLIESNYPLQHPEKPGSAVLFAESKKTKTDSLKRICCRCGATYSVSQTGKHIRKEECNYHYGKGVEKRAFSMFPNRFSPRWV